MEAGNGSASAHHRAGPLEIEGNVEDMFLKQPRKVNDSVNGDHEMAEVV